MQPNYKDDWDKIKNHNISAKDITYRSEKKVWWRCQSCKETYHMSPNVKYGQKQGCPYCAGKKVNEKNSLCINYPNLKKEWNKDLNKTLDIRDFTYGSKKKVWWKCLKCSNDFKSSINNRTSKKSGCPFCANRVVKPDFNLLKLYPEIAKEWHPNLNKNEFPENVHPGSREKKWWLCKNGHSYKAVVDSRTRRGSGCKLCSNQSSKAEIRVLTELMSIFDNVESRKRIKDLEIDIYLPNEKIGIEIDGKFWHKDKYLKDKQKGNMLNKEGIKLIRFRQYPLKKITSSDVFYGKDLLVKEELNNLCMEIKKYVNNIQVTDYLKKTNFVNEDLYRKYLSFLPRPLPQNSLQETNPILVKEWDYNKNKPLTPSHFSRGSFQKVFWVCNKGHSYKTNIYSRVCGHGCPYCKNKIPTKLNNLKSKFPEIASEWNKKKNGNLNPEDCLPYSHKKVWWICKNGHEWSTKINGRTNQNSRCKICIKQNLIPKNKSLYP